MIGWQVITLSLHRRGGGPLPRSAFDGGFENEAESKAALAEAKTLGMVVMAGCGATSVWSLTQLGRDWCAGKVIAVGGAWRRMVETPDERQRRIDTLVANADEAAVACARLTNHQREVLVLVAKGYTRQEICSRLGLGADAVESRITRMLVAIGCDRSIEAAVIAGKAGLA